MDMSTTVLNTYSHTYRHYRLACSRRITWSTLSMMRSRCHTINMTASVLTRARYRSPGNGDGTAPGGPEKHLHFFEQYYSTYIRTHTKRYTASHALDSAREQQVTLSCWAAELASASSHISNAVINQSGNESRELSYVHLSTRVPSA